MRIYIAGPYTADNPQKILRNIEAAMKVGAQVMQLGHEPFVPHCLGHHLECEILRLTDGKEEYSWERWMAWCLEWLKVSEAILHYAPSCGADMELAFAELNDLNIYTSIEEVPKVKR